MNQNVVGGTSEKVLSEHETIRIKFNGRETSISISGNGDMGIDHVTHGTNANLFEAMDEEEKTWSNPEYTLGYQQQMIQRSRELQQQQVMLLEQQTAIGQINNSRYEPSKAEKIQQYLYMLYEAQKADHNVHTEIEDALKSFKVELGI